jgi:hypothetical protein
VSNTGTIPILGTDGQVHSIPQNQASAALAAGGKPVAQVRDPQGQARWIPSDQVDDARAAGGTVVSRAPDPEEIDFLQNNPGHTWITRNPQQFPNRQEGIYPTGPGNEWRNDPSYQQSPVDLHLAKHTAEGAAYGAVAAGSAMALPAISSLTAPTTQLVRTGAGYMANWAEEAGPSALRQALSNPAVQQGLKMVAPKLIGGAATFAGGSAAYQGYKYLKSIGVIP